MFHEALSQLLFLNLEQFQHKIRILLRKGGGAAHQLQPACTEHALRPEKETLSVKAKAWL